MSKRQHRGRVTERRHKVARCEVCEERLVEGETVRTLLGGPSSGLHGHAACIDGVIAHFVDAHGLTYAGDFEVDRPG
jgi:hypothetical protein